MYFYLFTVAYASTCSTVFIFIIINNIICYALAYAKYIRVYNTRITINIILLYLNIMLLFIMLYVSC